jgi:hypothetical protein
MATRRRNSLLEAFIDNPASSGFFSGKKPEKTALIGSKKFPANEIDYL